MHENKDDVLEEKHKQEFKKSKLTEENNYRNESNNLGRTKCRTETIHICVIAIPPSVIALGSAFANGQ